ncbi:MAG TPA: SBBP repeat-containing protein, partial [Planctomycetota bacterium]|nr:SBBP repeat-containing protein [Planctomycetota bacterium]
MNRGYRRSVVSLGVLCVLAIVLACPGICGEGNPPARPKAPLNETYLAEADPGRGPAVPGLDDVLCRIADEHARGNARGVREQAQASDVWTDGTMVEVVLVPEKDGDSSTINKAGIAKLGGVVTARSRSLMQVRLPIAALPHAPGKVAGVRYVRPPMHPIECAAVAEVDSEAVQRTAADAWHAAEVTGSGAKVAVIDGGFAGLSAAISNGDIPASAITRDETGTGMEAGTSKHGTANAEGVCDLAPDAQLYLIKIDTEVHLENAKDYCISQGVHIINHSLGWFGESDFDGTGLYCDIANDADSHGILWINAAGNHALQHYQGAFVDSGSSINYMRNGTSYTKPCHRFPVQDFGSMIYVSYALPGDIVRCQLTWDAWQETNQDYDLFLYSYGLKAIIDRSRKDQTAGAPPCETIAYPVTSAGWYAFLVTKFSASRNHRLNLIVGDDPLMIEDAPNRVPAGSCTDPSVSPNVMAVGAIDQSSYTTGPQEDFSSQGPTNGGITKPDICGPDNCSSYTYGVWWGTSQSAPFAAGVAALVKSGFPAYTNAQIRSFLEGRAIDMGTAGKDNVYGSGRLALGAPPSTPTVFPVSSTECPTVSTECPASSTTCPVLDTQCPLTPASTVCPYVDTQCPANPQATVCPTSSTACPIVGTQCPTAQTVCPVVSTLCPATETQCPATPESTVCPTSSTACPVSVTQCPPVLPTQCPVSSTSCPVVNTQCPLSPASTVCPYVATQCPATPQTTVCPVAATSCPQVSTQCPTATTSCPASSTSCPAVNTSCPQVSTECPEAATACPVVLTQCPTASTSCPVVSTSCPLISTECPVTVTVCPAASCMAQVTVVFEVADQTTGSSVLTDDPTVNVTAFTASSEAAQIVGYAITETDEEPVSGWFESPPSTYTIQGPPGQISLYGWAKDSNGQAGCKLATILYSPAVPTVLPVSPTACPPAETQCPPVVTQCPASSTSCPAVSTSCPTSPTSCPPVSTQCPATATACPTVPTSCPATETQCPVAATSCPEAGTQCPETHTACPVAVTSCPPANTACPSSQTSCPTQATNCPAVATQCPAVATECPASSTMCPIADTQCPAAQVATVCPTLQTQCPVVATQCPPPGQHALSVQSSPITGIAITGDKPGTTNYTATCDDGQVVSLTAPATATVGGVDYNFMRWTVDGVNQQDGQASVQVTMNADHIVAAMYDAAQPRLVLSGYLGGTGNELGRHVALDACGNMAVTGETSSNDFPTGGSSSSLNVGYDAYVSKINAAGQVLWTSFIGGSGTEDHGSGASIGADGCVFVCGRTKSPDLPTPGGFQHEFGGSTHDAFVAKLTPSGQPEWVSYLGGSGDDSSYAITTDSAGNAYFCGYTAGGSFPASNGFDTTYNGGDYDAFLAKVTPAGQLEWATFLGGSGLDIAYGITTDPEGNVVLTGRTTSPDFPSSAYAGREDVFVTKISPTGALLWSTLIGGSFDDLGMGIACDASGGIFVTGYTSSPDLPTPGGLGTSLFGPEDAFVASLSGAGNLLWARYLGGGQVDRGHGVAVDASGTVTVVGLTHSSDLPILGGTYPTFRGGETDGFMARLSPSGQLTWATFLGGSNNDEALGVCVDSIGNVAAVGCTDSTGFPAVGGLDPTFNGGICDAFIVKIAFAPPGSCLTVRTTPVAGIPIAGCPPGVSDYTICDVNGDVRLTAPAVASVGGTHYAFARWVIEGSPRTAGELDTGVLPMDANHIAVAEYEVRRSLSVYSSPITGIAITGDKPGTTNYTAACDDGSIVQLTAPGTPSIGGTGYTFIRWEVDGQPKPDGQVAVSIQMDTDHLAVAVYRQPTGEEWSSFLGGPGNDNVKDVAFAPDGTIRITGFIGKIPPTSRVDPTRDAFVAKLSSCGVPIWTKMLNGSHDDKAFALAIAPDGSTFVIGGTMSSDFEVLNA